MSEDPEDSAVADEGYLLSGSEDTAASSISLSLGESSVRLKEKFKVTEKETESFVRNVSNADEKKWWLKRPETRLGLSANSKKSTVPTDTKHAPATEVTSSMKEFLEKEELCKSEHIVQALQKRTGDHNRDKDDTLCDILASAAFDKYPSDFENATDEDIGSFLEEMSKIAGALSPSSAQERMKSGDNSSKNPTEEEKSVEELLEEAEKLVRENVGLSKSSSRNDTLMIDEPDQPGDENTRSTRLERDIFQLIEREVQRETEKIRKSPKNQTKRRGNSPGCEVIYENENSLKLPATLITLDSQKKRFEDEKVEVSSSSDLDDPIDRHSRSEDPQKIEESRKDKDNLQKEITDVEKDFFDNLLKRSKEKLEGGISGSSSFGQEDFSHFLRILQGQERKEQETRDKRTVVALQFPHGANIEHSTAGNIAYPEKEITDILEKELPREAKDAQVTHKNAEKNSHEFSESNSSVASADFNSRNTKKETRSQSRDRSANQGNVPSHGSGISKISEREVSKKSTLAQQNSCEKARVEVSKKTANSKSELYNVGLTPRLELFADAIPKLIAERSNENVGTSDGRNKDNETETAEPVRQTANEEPDEISGDKLSARETGLRLKTDEKDKCDTEKMNSEDSNVTIITKSSPDRGIKVADRVSPKTENTRLGSSRSYDQLSKPRLNLRSSLDDVRSTKATDHARRIGNQPGKSLVVSRYSKQQMRQNTTSKPPSKITLKPSTPKFDPPPRVGESTTRMENSGKYHMAGGDSRKNFTKSDLEALFREEKHKNALLKEQIESEARMYKQQIQSMRTSFEEELFALKKQNIILKAKIDELTLNEKRGGISNRIDSSKSHTRVQLLEKELEKQEGIINAYETENKRLVAEMERLYEEAKNSKPKPRSKVEINETQRLNDTIKDLREDALKLNIEVSDLRQKNNDSALKIDDLMQQNSLLKDELEMFKEQLRTKNEFINARLQTMTAAELESRKKVDDLGIELRSKNEQLKNIKIEYEKLEQAILPLEKEVFELRTNEKNLTEKLQVSKIHVEREKQLTLKLKDQVILDNKKILDLNRQVREMERILKRKNPDSVSALILTAKSDHERINLEKIKLLEDRVASLEGEIKAKEQISQEKLCELQKKFAEMKEKYATQVSELEEKLLIATMREEKVFNDTFTQTVAKSSENKGVDASTSRRDALERSSSLQIDRDDRKEVRNVKIGPKSQNPKEDTHLIATIRGLKLELTNKDKNFAKINKELQELQKTNRRLQKEREKLLNDRRGVNKSQSGEFERNGRSASVCSDQRFQAARSTETNDLNSNHCQNGHLSNGNTQRLSGSVPRLYDPLQYSENEERTCVKKLTSENTILKEELNKINKDFMTLKNKRLHDLNLLQEEHEREMAALVKEYSLKFGDSKVVKLQGQINTQVAVITHLKQQIEKLRDYKEQVLVLKVEREHLESKVKTLSEKVKYLSTPGTEQLQLLQDKITILQQRHESREMTLQNLVRDLLRNKTQCRDCKGEKGKSNKQLCYFRQELDHILGMLQEISNVQ